MNISQIHIVKNGKLVKIGEMLRDTIGLDEDYIAHLLKEDDWTMVILSYVLIEAYLTEAISSRLKCDNLSSYIQSLGVGGRTGKCRLAFDLGLLSKDQRKFIDKFSEIRNRFAHSVRQFKITFDKYFEDRKEDDFASALCIRAIPKAGEEFFKKGTNPVDHVNFDENKKIIILVNVVLICHTLCLHRSISSAENSSTGARPT